MRGCSSRRCWSAPLPSAGRNCSLPMRLRNRLWSPTTLCRQRQIWRTSGSGGGGTWLGAEQLDIQIGLLLGLQRHRPEDAGPHHGGPNDGGPERPLGQLAQPWGSTPNSRLARRGRALPRPHSRTVTVTRILWTLSPATRGQKTSWRWPSKSSVTAPETRVMGCMIII